MMLAFFICGIFAGAAGALQVTAVYHRLIPIHIERIWFSGTAGCHASQLPGILGGAGSAILRRSEHWQHSTTRLLKLDSSLAGVLQGTLVLFVLMADGARRRLLRKT
jgi:general nucleoside transport system permease protein